MKKGNILYVLLVLTLFWGYLSLHDNFFLSLLTILLVSWVITDDIDSLKKEVRNLNQVRKQ